MLPSHSTILFEVHGESVDNQQGLASGHRDVPLSPRGRQQARDLGDRYRQNLPAAVFCSDLQRSYTTGDLAFADPPMPIIRDARLRECDYGTWTGRAAAVVEVARNEHREVPFPAGESYLDVVRRVGDFVTALRSGPLPERVLIIGHRGTWFALEHLLGGRALSEVLSAPWVWRPGWRYELRVSLNPADASG
jgi:broad specificity phosphatase PhoE